MARLARVVARGIPHHVTHRVACRTAVFVHPEDRDVCLEFLAFYTAHAGLAIWIYRLKTSHVHMIAVPEEMEHDDDGLVTRAGDLEIARDAATGRVEGTALGDVATTTTYTLFGQTAAWASGIAGGAALYSTEYEYDKLGRIIGLSETIEDDSTEYEYVYNAADRLQAVVADGDWLTSYTYDLNGNRLSRYDGATTTTTTGTYDAQDRLLSWGAATFEYNANGELVSKSEGGDSTEYTYDPLGNLLRVILPDDTQIDYIIDGLNRRIGKKVDGQLVQGFLYAGGLLPVAELDADGAVVSVFGPGFMLQGGNTYRILSDHRGGPRLVVNAATGAVVERRDYDEYGRVTRDDIDGDIQDYRPLPFGFAGGLYDRNTGLVRFGARDYDPEIGRWTTKDPIRFDGGLNFYGYVLGDPINAIDPSGLGGGSAFPYDAIIWVKSNEGWGHRNIFIPDYDTGNYYKSDFGPSTPDPISRGTMNPGHVGVDMLVNEVILNPGEYTVVIYPYSPGAMSAAREYVDDQYNNHRNDMYIWGVHDCRYLPQGALDAADGVDYPFGYNPLRHQPSGFVKPSPFTGGYGLMDYYSFWKFWMIGVGL